MGFFAPVLYFSCISVEYAIFYIQPTLQLRLLTVLLIKAVPEQRQMASCSDQLRCHHPAVVTGVEVTLERIDVSLLSNKCLPVPIGEVILMLMSPRRVD